MADNKSVFEHLDIIESKIDSSETPKSISDMISEPFDAYFDSSTVYYYEPDERKFNRYKVKETQKIDYYDCCIFNSNYNSHHFIYSFIG